MGKRMTKYQAAGFLNIPVSTLEKLVEKEKIPYEVVGRIGCKVLFNKGDLISWKKSRK